MKTKAAKPGADSAPKITVPAPAKAVPGAHPKPTIPKAAAAGTGPRVVPLDQVKKPSDA